MEWEKKGINVNGKYLNNLRFADDIVLISSNIEELRGMIIDLIKESKKARLEMNFEKTKILGQKEEGIEIKICLLYTSPSPRDRTRSRMPSSA